MDVVHRITKTVIIKVSFVPSNKVLLDVTSRKLFAGDKVVGIESVPVESVPYQNYRFSPLEVFTNRRFCHNQASYKESEVFAGFPSPGL